MLITRPILINFNHTFSRPKRELPFISTEQNSYVCGMASFWEVLYLQGVSEEKKSLLPSQEAKIHWKITNQPGRSGLPDVTYGKLIHFDALCILF